MTKERKRWKELWEFQGELNPLLGTEGKADPKRERGGGEREEKRREEEKEKRCPSCC